MSLSLLSKDFSHLVSISAAFMFRMLIQKWPAFSQSSSETWILCLVISLLAWYSSARDRGLRDLLSWTRYPFSAKKRKKEVQCIKKEYECKLILLFLQQANNDILAFLSGMPVTRNTRYLDLKTQ